MKRRIPMVVAVPALICALGCGGLVDVAFEAVRDLTSMISGAGGSPTAGAQKHCGSALNNARLYEDVAPIDAMAIGLCESWYGESASEAELATLACMAGALDEAGWHACRGSVAPVEDEDELVASGSSDRFEKAKGRKVQLEVRELDLEIAENAGVLGALRDGTELDGVFGSSDMELTGGIGGLIGAKGTQIGSGGLGSRGSGLGGGGTAEGLGGLGTKGQGSGASGYGSGGGNFGAKGEDGSAVVGDPIILGALDKSLIDAVIKRHMNQLRYCYQRELTTNPGLGGKIVVKFVISKDGSVASAAIKTSTMGNAAVEGCMTGRFMRFQFPEPKGGGIVIVSYPFVFTPGS